MKKHLRSSWRIVRWPLLVLLLIYIYLVIKEIHWPVSQAKTDAAITEIKAAKITMADVDGSRLPPQPDPAKNNATLEGIDANHNGIRDDVELAIFKKYPDNLKLRAAELQYAMTEQMFLTRVFNSETWKAVAGKDSRAYLCLGETFSRSDISKYVSTIESRAKEVRTLVNNTPVREEARTTAFKFETSSGASNGSSVCDVS